MYTRKNTPVTPKKKKIERLVDPNQKVLLDACISGDIETVSRLISVGTKISFLDNLNPPIIEAVKNGHEDIVKLLIENGAYMYETELEKAPHFFGYNSAGETVMHIAAWKGYDDLISYLKSKGMNLSKQDVYGYTPLFVAIYNIRLSTVERLVSLGAGVSEVNREGKTPLWLATTISFIECIEFLVSKGADPSYYANEGECAWTVAKKDYRPQIFSIFIRHGYPPGLSVIDKMMSGSEAPIIDLSI